MTMVLDVSKETAALLEVVLIAGIKTLAIALDRNMIHHPDTARAAIDVAKQLQESLHERATD